jgi:hypothetical protein
MQWREIASGERAAVSARYLLMALAVGWFLCGGGEKAPNVLRVDPAHASVPVGAAVSYLSFTTKDAGNGKFFITDTNKKVILTYALDGQTLRLVSARKFDHDLKLFDGSIKAPESLEAANNGLTREDVKHYAKNSKAQLDALAKKFGQPALMEDE